MVDIFIQIVPKLVAAFLIMMIYIHLSGKGSLAPISTIDQVGNVVLGAIIGGNLGMQLHMGTFGVLLCCVGACMMLALIEAVFYVTLRVPNMTSPWVLLWYMRRSADC